MRGSIEPADYKRYVLPLIFLRFLSIRFEKRRNKLQEMVKEAEAAEILAAPDEYHSVHTKYSELLRNTES